MFRRIILYLIPYTLYLSLSAQVKDAGFWSSFSMDKKITQKVSIGISEEFRFNENVSELGSFFTDAGISYKLNDDIKFSGSYRFINKRQMDDSYSKRHRYYFDLSYRKKVKKLTTAIRLRAQSQYADVFSSDDGTIPEWYLRSKFSLRYNMKGKWTPYLASELFYHFVERVVDNARYTGGVERKINNKLDLDLFFLHQREMNVKNPTYDYIWGIGLNYSL